MGALGQLANILKSHYFSRRVCSLVLLGNISLAWRCLICSLSLFSIWFCPKINMVFVKPILHQSILILRFFSQQKINNIFPCLVGAVIFWSGYVLMGIGKATALIRELRLCEMSSLFLNGEDFGEFSESRLPNNFDKRLPAEWMSPCRAPRCHGVAAFSVGHSVPSWSCNLVVVVGSDQEDRRPFCLSVHPFFSLSSLLWRARIMQKIMKSSLPLSESWIKTPAPDGVLLIMLFWIKYQKHWTSVSNKEPTVLFVEQGI